MVSKRILVKKDVKKLDIDEIWETFGPIQKKDRDSD